jgi:hypothetical protein
MPNISIDASFNGVSKTKNVFSIENAPQEVVDELLGLIGESINTQPKPPIDVSVVVTVDGEQKVNFSKSMSLVETAAAEMALIDALDKFVTSHNN